MVWHLCDSDSDGRPQVGAVARYCQAHLGDLPEEQDAIGAGAVESEPLRFVQHELCHELEDGRRHLQRVAGKRLGRLASSSARSGHLPRPGQ